MGEELERRTFVVGALGSLALTACGGPKSTSPADPSDVTTPARGPARGAPDPPTSITAEEQEAWLAGVNAALGSGDLPAVVRAMGIDGGRGDDGVERWRRRLRNLRKFDLTRLEIVLGDSEEPRSNAAGGPVAHETRLVLVHQIRDCDAAPVAQTFPCVLRKERWDAPLTVSVASDSDDVTSPAPWDVGELEVLSGPHSVVVVATSSRGVGEQWQQTIDRGARRALEAVPPMGGTSKLVYAVGWENDAEVFGGAGKVSEALGSAHFIAYRDPSALADDSYEPERGTEPYAGARLQVYARALRSSVSEVERTVMHEGIHGIAWQWGRARENWVIEGLAVWASEPSATFAPGGRNRTAGRAGLSSLRRTHGAEGSEFYDPAALSGHNAAAGCVFAYLAESRGRQTALDFAKAVYESDLEADTKVVIGLDFRGLFDAVAAWI